MLLKFINAINYVISNHLYFNKKQMRDQEIHQATDKKKVHQCIISICLEFLLSSQQLSQYCVNISHD